MLRADVEVGERSLGLDPSRWLGGRSGGKGIPRLCQDAVGWVSSRARAQAPVAQQQVETPCAEVRQPPGQVGRLNKLSRVLWKWVTFTRHSE